jgi:hypothetical protein
MMPIKQDFLTNGPMTDIMRRLNNLEKSMRDQQSSSVDIVYMAGGGRVLQMIEVTGSWADMLMHALAANWPTAFTSLDTAWFMEWNTYDVAYCGALNFSANAISATAQVKGMNDVLRIQHVVFYGIGVL